MISTNNNDTSWAHLSIPFKQALSETNAPNIPRLIHKQELIQAISSLKAFFAEKSQAHVLFISETIGDAYEFNKLIKTQFPEYLIALLLPHHDLPENPAQITIIPLINIELSTYLNHRWQDYSLIFASAQGMDKIRSIQSEFDPEALLIPCGLTDILAQEEVKKAEPQKAEPQKAEPKKAEPQKAEPKKAEPQKAEPKKAKPQKVEPQKVESQKTKPQKVELQKTEPQKAEITENSNRVVMVDRTYKRSYLRNHLKNSDAEKTVIVTRTRHNAHRLEEYLYQGRIRSRIIHANLSDPAKNTILERFNKQEIKILIIPENVLAQLPLTDISQIIFFDLPDLALDFKARIESIQSALNNGESLSVISNDELSWIKAMEEETGLILPIDRVERTTPSPKNSQELSEPAEVATEVTIEATNNTNWRSKNKFLRGHKENKTAPKERHFAPKPPVRKRRVAPTTVEQKPQSTANDSFNQAGIVNENRTPFASDSFEASVARQNKQRARNFFSQQTPTPRSIQEHSSNNSSSKDVKIIHRKKRTFDEPDGNR